MYNIYIYICINVRTATETLSGQIGRRCEGSAPASSPIF